MTTADSARSAAGVVWLRPGRGTNDDVTEASGRDPYDRNLGIAYDLNSAVNIDREDPRTLTPAAWIAAR